MKISHPALPLKVTPADYQPPGFKEGECDSLWFEGMAVHFKVGEVQTAFHSLRVCVSAEQGRLEKLQEGSHFRETKQVPPEREMMMVGLQYDFLGAVVVTEGTFTESKQNTHRFCYFLSQDYI